MIRRRVGIYVAMCAEARVMIGSPLAVQTPVAVSNDVVLWIGGVGGAAAEQGCRALMEAGANALASVGTAAGLAPECVPGTLALPRQIVQTGHPAIPVNDIWRGALHSAVEGKVRVADGTLAGTEDVLGSSGKHALHRETGAVSADMESAAVAAYSARSGVPLIVVRAVSDGHRDGVPASIVEAVDDFGRPDYGRLLFSLARHPREINEVLRLAAGFRAACRTLRLVIRCSDLRFGCPE